MDLTSILAAWPHVFDAVTRIEGAAKGASGPKKKNIFIGSIMAAAKIGEAIPIPQVQAVSALADAIVSELNNAGVFTHSDKAAAKP